MANNQILLKITGKDTSGITSSLTSILAETETKIIDIEQVVIHDLLSLSILVELDTDTTSKSVLKELLFKAKEIGINLDFEVITDGLINRSSLHTYAITCLGSEISAKFISELTTTLAIYKVNIERITKLNQEPLTCIELIVYAKDSLNIPEIRASLLSLSKKHKADLAFQKENLYRKSKRLLVLDMDMTLIQMEVINEIAEQAGVGEKVSEITHKAMNGDINFDEALEERVNLLKGLAVSELETVYNRIKMTDGAERLVKVASHLGYKTAVISGGFSYFTEKIKDKLGLTYAYANNLEVIDGKLTGKLTGQIVNAERKSELLKEIAKKENISIDQVIAVGDGANDVPMLTTAGLGIAFNAKPLVRQKAGTSLSSQPLSSIFYLLGITEKDLQELDLF